MDIKVRAFIAKTSSKTINGDGGKLKLTYRFVAKGTRRISDISQDKRQVCTVLQLTGETVTLLTVLLIVRKKQRAVGKPSGVRVC